MPRELLGESKELHCFIKWIPLHHDESNYLESLTEHFYISNTLSISFANPFQNAQDLRIYILVPRRKNSFVPQLAFDDAILFLWEGHFIGDARSVPSCRWTVSFSTVSVMLFLVMWYLVSKRQSHSDFKQNRLSIWIKHSLNLDRKQ